ncbi:MAG: uroporphyrinogen decarboxylase [Bacteroidetes bacterium]|nr:uroporphyrinogen decarboxylase [Bacteroidota bacterium]
MNDLFLRACRRQAVDRTPLWMMRQAGRYLPEYRAVRARSDFLTMCRTPELAAEVTLQPVDLVGVDAAIIFSDILVVPEAMGMTLEMEESRGPRLSPPVRSRGEIERLSVPDPERSLRYVMNAIGEVRRGLAGRVPLIGFTGSPWTLAAYMIEGGGARDLKYSKALMLDDPAALRLLLEKLAVSVRLYLEAQIAAGAQAVQIFDTLGGALTPDQYRAFSLETMYDIVSRMNRSGVPVIVFSKGAHHSLREMAQIGADVVGLDWTIDIAEARALVGDRTSRRTTRGRWSGPSAKRARPTTGADHGGA